MENTSNTQHGERAEGWPALSMADDAVAFPTLDDSELAVLEALGSRRSVAVGEYLYREGDATYDFYVILSGAAQIVVRFDGEERIITRHGPGQFLGELNLLSGQRVYLSARVVGSRFSPESLRVREFLARNGIPHEWLDPDRDAAVEGLLREFSVTPGELPVVIASGSVLHHPTPGGLAEYLGLTINSLPERCFDLVVVGAGPAGLAAAVYGASEGLRTLVVEMAAVGGQAGTSSRIENYLGFPTGISGGDLTQRAVVQAEKFGAQLTSPCAASSLREEAGHLVIRLSDGTDVAGRAVIVASGARCRRLDAPRLADFEGNGVYYAATEMEARLCAGSPVVVAGGGNSAGQAALFLAAAGSPVTLVIRSHDLHASMSRYLIDRIEADARIEVRTNSKITGLDGDRTLTSVRVTTEGFEAVLPGVALFSFIGADPAASWLSGCAALDARGFVLTDRSLGEDHLDGRWEALSRRPLPFETSYPGLFAVGDVRASSTKRVAAAVGEGSASVRSVHEYLAFAH